MDRDHVDNDVCIRVSCSTSFLDPSQTIFDLKREIKSKYMLVLLMMQMKIVWKVTIFNVQALFI